MHTSILRINLLGGISGAGDGGGAGAGAGAGAGGGSILLSKNKVNNHSHRNMSIEDSSPYPVDDHDHYDDDDDDVELGLGLSIGGGLRLRTKEEASRILTGCQDSPNLKPSCSSSSSSSSSVNISASSIVGTKRPAILSVSPPNSTSVVGWPPIKKAHRVPTLANRVKPKHDEFSSRLETKNTTNSHHLTVKVNMDGTLIGRKVDLYAQTSYETLAQTLENMFYERWSSTEAVGSSRLLNETSEFVLTYEDKDGDCMLVGDVPWQMFLSSVRRLRILRNPKMQH